MPSIRHLIYVGMAALLLAMLWIIVWSELILRMLLPSPIQNIALFFFGIAYGTQLVYLFFMQNPKQYAACVFTAFFFMGMFIHLFFAALTKDALLFIPGFVAHEQILSYVFFILALLISWGGNYVAFHGPKIKRVLIPIDQTHAALNGFKIAQISDLHTGPLIGKKYIERVAELTHKLKADLIVLTGDIGDSNAVYFGAELAPLGKMHAPHGIFFVTGNHEYYWNAEEWIAVIRSHGIKPLLNEGISILNNKIWLGGVTDPDGPQFIPSHVPDPIKALHSEKSRGAYKILLAHQPKNCFAAEGAGFDLMLSGHTHGGQFFPLNLLVGFFNPYSKSLNQHGNMLVYVSLGTGFWGPALRLGVTAEITLLELRA